MYRESVAWFAAEHLLAGGRPTDIDRRYDTSADSSADMVTFEPVRDWELVGTPRMVAGVALFIVQGG
ncbi:hypothetical protein ACWFMI_01820 [Nocardiopsis terrae]